MLIVTGKKGTKGGSDHLLLKCRKKEKCSKGGNIKREKILLKCFQFAQHGKKRGSGVWRFGQEGKRGKDGRDTSREKAMERATGKEGSTVYGAICPALESNKEMIEK